MNRARWNADDQNPIVQLVMLNVGRYCGVTVRTDYRPAEAVGGILSQPEHGRARMRQVGGAVQAEYLPAPGFSGEDSFRARFGPGPATLTVHVTVRQPGA